MKMLNLNKGLWRCFPHPQRDDDAGDGDVDGSMTMMMMMVMVMWTDMAIDGVLAVAIAGASFNILFCVLLPPHLGLRFGLTLAIFC